MAKLNTFDDVLEFAGSATPETVSATARQIYPAIVELGLDDVEAGRIFAALKTSGGATITDLRKAFGTYLRVNDLTAEQESVGTKLVKLALDNNLELWHDLEGNPWATLRVNGHAEHHPLKTKAIQLYLTHLFYREYGSAPYAQGVQEALATLAAKAVFEGPQHPTFTRLAEVDGAIHLDLANDTWQVVRITPHGWTVIEADGSPVRFRRARGMLPIPVPVQGGSLSRLAELLNVKTDSRDWLLIVAWLLQGLRGTGPYPVLVLTGGQGSGKSTAAKMLKSLLDPNVSPLRSLSRDERDLFIAAMNGWALAFDNISGLSQWVSDALCKLSTGGGLSTRELRSDSDETLLDAVRPVILNGITDFVHRQDLVDRALQVNLPAIPKSERKLEKAMWEQFNAVQPGILGALLDVMVVGLQRLPYTELESLPRLADFALWASACEQPLGWHPGAFTAAYQDAQDDLIKDALEAEPVAVHLQTFATVSGWTGTATELLEDLTAHAFGEKRPPKGWPGASNALSGALKRIAPALLAQGVEVESLNRGDKKGSKKWRVSRIEEKDRQNRQNESENPRKPAQDGVYTSDDTSDDASSSDDRTVRTVRGPSGEKVRAGRHSDASDDTDDEKPYTSKDKANEKTTKRGGVDL